MSLNDSEVSQKPKSKIKQLWVTRIDNSQYLKNLETSMLWRLAELIERGVATTHG
jgi:hypothetical protein